MHIKRLLLLLLVAACTCVGESVLAQTDTSEATSAWDRLYGGYDATFKSWKDLPGVEQYSYITSGDPYIVLKPRLDSVEHRGTLGIRLPESWAVLKGAHPRIEGGGSSDEGTYKTQLNLDPNAAAPFVVRVKDPLATQLDLSGFGLALKNSYTFSQLERQFFIDYKVDYQLTPAILMTPKIGYVYSELRQTHHHFTDVPLLSATIEHTEEVREDSHGIRTGADFEVPIGGGFDLLFGTQFTLSYDETDMRATTFELLNGYYYAEDGSVVLSRTTDLTLGLRKELWGAAFTVTGGISFYSDMPRIVNPVLASDMDAHLEYQSARSEYVRVGVSRAF